MHRTYIIEYYVHSFHEHYHNSHNLLYMFLKHHTEFIVKSNQAVSGCRENMVQPQRQCYELAHDNT